MRHYPRFICDKAVSQGWEPIMSDTVVAPSKTEPRRNSPAEQNALAQVEKWLAVIRELAREQAARAN